MVNSDYSMPKESPLAYSPNAFRLNDATVSTAEVTPQSTVPQTGDFKQYNVYQPSLTIPTEQTLCNVGTLDNREPEEQELAYQPCTSQFNILNEDYSAAFAQKTTEKSEHDET